MKQRPREPRGSSHGASSAATERLKPIWAGSRGSARRRRTSTSWPDCARAPDAIGPFAIFVVGGDEPVAAIAGRVESRRLQTAVGYRAVYAPRVRLLHVVDGGIVVADAGRARAARRARSAPSSPAARPTRSRCRRSVGSELCAAFESLGGPLQRQPLIAPWTRRRLVLPGDVRGVRRVAELEHALADPARREARRRGARRRLSVEVVREPDRARAARPRRRPRRRATYQRALGAGFADTPEQRELARVGLERGWVRGYLLYRGASRSPTGSARSTRARC